MGRTARHTALVADEHELYRSGLRHLLVSALGFNDVIEAASMPEAIDRLAANPGVSLALVDLGIAGMNGIGGLRSVRRLRPALPIVAITVSARHEELLQVLAAGGRGLAPKSLSAAAFVQGIEAVLNGQLFVATGQSGFAGLAMEMDSSTTGPTTVALTPRQEQVIRLIAEGKSNKEIARTLRLAEGTIKVHVNALYRTLSVRNRASAVAALAQHGWYRSSHAMSAI